MSREAHAHSDAVEAVTARTRRGSTSGGNHNGAKDETDETSAKAPIYEGLAGVVIASTEICEVDGERGTLSYRGYDIGELACHATFEETVYLLWYGEVPSRSQLETFSASLAAQREIDDDLWEMITRFPTTIDPMDGLRTAVSSLASCDPIEEPCREAAIEQAQQLVAKFPTLVANIYRHIHGLERAHPHPDLGHAADFLAMVTGKVPTEMEARAMDLAMLLMAEHGFNASTFSARVTAATLSDMVSAVTSAIGTLKGPLHGGANQRAMKMMMEIGDVSNVEPYVDDALARKQRIMGFGHRVYRQAADPRSAYLRGRLYELCAAADDFHYYELATAIAETVEARKGLYPNVDFYAAPVLLLAGVPLELFVTVFAISRIPGWTAHIMEQQAKNRLIRPLAAYTGPEHLTYKPMDERG